MIHREQILVIGHRNPDMDAIASAAGYAWLLNEYSPQGYLGARTGEVNAQTAFALQRFGVSAPALVSDVYPRIGDVTEAVPALSSQQTILDACNHFAQTRSALPLVSDERKPLGLLSSASLFARLVEPLASGAAETAAALAQPAAEALDDGGLILRASETVRDVVPQLTRLEQDDFLVLDETEQYAGLCRKSALLSPPRQRVILVDHNEVAQAVPGVETGEVMEIIDHHRLDAPPTALPIRVQVEAVGSCSTLVAERAFGLGNSFPPGIAGLLLCGILSDTLVFRSPTFTPRDRTAALRLGAMAGLYANGSAEDEQLSAIAALGQELLAAGAGLGARPAAEIVSSDLKFYTEGESRMAIAQVEVTTFDEFIDRLPELRDAVTFLVDEHDLALAVLMVTDIVRGNSRLLVGGARQVISALPYTRMEPDVLNAPGVVWRKKQLLPALTAVLA